MLRGIQFRTARRQGEQPHVFWDSEFVGRMPRSLIQPHDNYLVSEIDGHLLEKERHHLGVGIGQDQSCQPTQVWTYGSTDRQQLRDHLIAHLWTDGFGCPTSSWRIDAPKASFLLCHEHHRSLIVWGTISQEPLSCLTQVFLNGSCSISVLWGCFGRGTSLRHSWRCSIL